MNSKNIPIYLFLTIFLLSSCISEDTYVTPCRGKYGSKKVIDSIKNILNLEKANVEFVESYKNGIGAPSNCDTIPLTIYGDSIPIINTDTFVKSISCLFFNDTANTNVKYLKITAINYGSTIGKLEVTYLVDRSSCNNYLAPSQTADTAYNIKYKIVKEMPYVKYSGNENKKSKGIKVEINFPIEFGNIQNLTEELTQKYKSVITENFLDEFELNMKIEKPGNKYCISKVYYLYYEKEKE